MFEVDEGELFSHHLPARCDGNKHQAKFCPTGFIKETYINKQAQSSSYNLFC